MTRPIIWIHLAAALLLTSCQTSPEDDDDGGDDDGGDDDGGDDDGGDDDGGDDDGGDDDTAGVDPLELAAEVSEQELADTIQDLQDFGTRYTFTDGDDLARDYLYDRLEAYGYDVELDPFTVQNHPVDNVIARKPGAVEPDVVYLYSAHYDSTSNQPETNAPGADDNASGVAAVLEAARILADHDFRYSIWFVLTGAEEQGSRGSEHMVGWMTAQDIDAQGVIAPDMIGYWPLGDGDAMDILGDPDSTFLVEHMAGIADELGVPNKEWINHSYCYGDDHSNFQEAGFPAITPMDCVEAHNIPNSGESVPHYHKTSDTLGTLYMPFTADVAAVIVGALADLAEPVGA